MGYRLFSDMTADVSDELMAGMPTVEFVPMQVELGGKSYTYGPEGDLTVEHFYAEQRGGKFASTSQINPMVYREGADGGRGRSVSMLLVRHVRHAAIRETLCAGAEGGLSRAQGDGY